MITKPLLISLGLLCCMMSSSAYADPQGPIIQRDMQMISNGQFNAPHLPPFQTSLDGRIALGTKTVDDKFQFHLIAPEKLNNHFINSQNGSYILNSVQPYPNMGNEKFYGGNGTLRHNAICEAYSDNPTPTKQNNPYACGIGSSTTNNTSTAVSPTNLALGKTTKQSSNSTLYAVARIQASKAVDGNTDGAFNQKSIAQTNPGSQQWWEVDLGDTYNIDEIRLFNRTGCCSSNLTDFHVLVSKKPFTAHALAESQAQSGVNDFHHADQVRGNSSLSIDKTGRYVRVQLTGNRRLQLAEVEVIGTPLNSGGGGTVTASTSGSQDCYDLNVITSEVYTRSGSHYVKLWQTPITVTVDNPKTANASIASIETSTPVSGPELGINTFLEPMVTRDGHFIVARSATNGFLWRNPNTGANSSMRLDTMYLSSPTSAEACDVTQWKTVHPITHAPHDPQVNKRYGFAMNPMRDTEGVVYEDGQAIGATYPWLDRDGDNLFLTTHGRSLSKTDYTVTCPASTNCTNITADTNPTRGHAVMGLWTHGKMVLLDNHLNAHDFDNKAANSEHRTLQLYTANSAPFAPKDGKTLVGTGRDASNNQAAGSAQNTSFIHSVEHLFNYRKQLMPSRFADVVWRMSNGRSTEEVVFDDFLDKNMLLYAPMNYSLTKTPLPNLPHNRLSLVPNHGDNGNTARMQNAATSLSWSIPAYGTITNGRIEPIAQGGVFGRGMWLDDNTSVNFKIPAQNRSVAAENWFYSLFLDTRNLEDTERVLLTFPEGSSVRMQGPSRFRFYDKNNKIVKAITLRQPMQEQQWTHFSFKVLNGGADVKVYVNGYPFSTWHNKSTIATFLPTQGTITIGKSAGINKPGFIGWIDEFKVTAATQNPELVCNHANGTLMGIDASSPAALNAISQQFAVWAHNEITEQLQSGGHPTFDRYVCYSDNNGDDFVHRGLVQDDNHWVREGVLFPEGPLHYGEPRPDSTNNQFCTGCHSNDDKLGLHIGALQGIPVNAENDPRRQPLQGPRIIYGNIPAGTFGNPNAVPASVNGVNIDQWQLSQ